MRDFRIHGLLGGAAVVTATVAVAVSLGASVASAHTNNVVDSCEGLSVEFDLYQGPEDNNRVEVTIDGQTQTFDFGESFVRDFPWSPTSPHTWTVKFDVNRNSEGHPTAFDGTTSGSQEACDVPPTTSVPDTTSTTVPDTTSTTVPDTTSTTVPDTTSTTVPDTTSTTVPDTTSTTVPDTTSTTVPDTTSTTVAVTVTEPPTTPAPTTAVDVQVAPPLPGVTPAPPSVDPPVVPATLPTTGGNTNGIAVAGALLLAAGALGLLAARRQRQHG